MSAILFGDRACLSDSSRIGMCSSRRAINRVTAIRCRIVSVEYPDFFHRNHVGCLLNVFVLDENRTRFCSSMILYTEKSTD